MKIYKYLQLILLIFILLVLSYTGLYIKNSQPLPTPASDLTLNRLRLNYALTQNHLRLISNYNYYPWLDQVEFYIDQNDDNQPIKISFSLLKDPFLQATSLQPIFKAATMKSKQVEFIDLSSKHPYATFKNN